MAGSIALLGEVIPFVIAGATVVLAVYALAAFRRLGRQVALPAMSAIIVEIGTREIREERAKIWTNSGKIINKGLSLKEEDKPLSEAIEKVAVSFDRVGWFVHRDKRLQDDVLEFVGHSLGRMWDICSKYIIEFRKKEDLPSYRYFEHLAVTWKARRTRIESRSKIRQFGGRLE